MANVEGNLLGSVVAVAAAAAAALFAADVAFDWSDDRIAANERARVVARLNSVLEPALRGRDLTTTLITATDPELLGSDDPIDVFVLSQSGTPAAIVFAPVAPHGYNAVINLLIGISPAATSPARAPFGIGKRKGSATPSTWRRAIGCCNSTANRSPLRRFSFGRSIRTTATSMQSRAPP